MTTVASPDASLLAGTAPALVVMGVSGSGKTTVGTELARRLGVRFRDADEFHPAANVAKMSAGTPLEDADRWPWLDAIAAAIRATPDDQPVVVSSSALRRVYRDRIRKGAGRAVEFVYLHGPRDLLAKRMTTRTGHFMPVSLLDSQLATLEPPGADEPVIPVSIELPVGAIADHVMTALSSRG